MPRVTRIASRLSGVTRTWCAKMPASSGPGWLTSSQGVKSLLMRYTRSALLPDTHPTSGAFPTSYIIKDLSYALALAESAGVTLEQATTTKRLMERTVEAGYRDSYYTAVIRTIEQR